MAASGESVRIQLSFVELPVTVEHKLSKSWFQVNVKNTETVSDVIERIVTKFCLPLNQDNLQLTLDGCMLPKWETSRIFRDNDLIW